MLSSALGHEVATRLVSDSLLALGLGGSSFSHEEAAQIFERLTSSPGLIGITTRVALARLRRSSREPVAPPISTSMPKESATLAHASRGGNAPTKLRPLTFVASLLGSSIGEEKALVLVRDMAVLCGYSREALTLAEAIVVLERLAERDGIEGIAARFAKTRLHLSF
jgi:hypothetical protein